MTRDREDKADDGEKTDITAPPGGKTHEATTPPGQGERDEDAIRAGEEKLEQAGGGH